VGWEPTRILSVAGGRLRSFPRLGKIPRVVLRFRGFPLLASVVPRLSERTRSALGLVAMRGAGLEAASIAGVSEERRVSSP
jgi:hypothetical protein